VHGQYLVYLYGRKIAGFTYRSSTMQYDKMNKSIEGIE